MPVVQKSAQVPYSAEKMYALVNGVARYPHFLPWCAAAEVLEQTDTLMVARLAIAKGPFREKFTTRNTLTPHRHIHLSLVDGPFRLLEGDWRFMPEGPGRGSRVSLDLQFEFGSSLTARLISPVFESIAGRFVEAFCAEARNLYGKEYLPE
jgi:ribosome-associated toxin RatA of RatAB toxin-antitoxin module